MVSSSLPLSSSSPLDMQQKPTVTAVMQNGRTVKLTPTERLAALGKALALTILSFGFLLFSPSVRQGYKDFWNGTRVLPAVSAPKMPTPAPDMPPLEDTPETAAESDTASSIATTEEFILEEEIVAVKPPKYQLDPLQIFKEIESETQGFVIDYMSEFDVMARFSNIPCPINTAVCTKSNFDHIHGNYVNTLDGRQWIATQAPQNNPLYLDRFWEIVLDESELIVDLTNHADTKKGVTPYYPTSLAEEIKLSEITITLIDIKQVESDMTLYTYKLKHLNGQTKTVDRLHFTGWQDFGGADSEKLIRIAGYLDQLYHYSDKKFCPIVHCRAGVGRTGTLITLTTLYNLLLNEKKEYTDQELKQTIKKIILSGRMQRGPMFVQSEMQMNAITETVNCMA